MILLFASFLATASLAAESEPLFQLEPAFETVKDARHAAFFDGKLRVDETIWDVASASQVDVMKYSGQEGVTSSSDGQLAVFKERKMVNVKEISRKPDVIVEASAVAQVYLWDVQRKRKGRKLGKFKFHCTPTTSGFQPIHCPDVRVTFSPDGKRFILNVPAGEWRKHEGNMPRYFPLEGWKAHLSDAEGKLKELPGYSIFLRSGRLVSFVFNDRKLQQLVDGDTGESVSFPRNAWWSPIRHEFNADESVLWLEYYSGHDGPSERIQAWNVATGERVIDKVSYGSDRLKLAVAADGAWAVLRDKSSGSPVLTGFDLRDKGRSRPLPAFEAIDILEVSPDGKHLAADNKNKMTVVYRISGGAAPVAKPAPVAVRSVDVPPAVKVPLDPNAYAVVIGVEKYREAGIPRVDYAARDAAIMHRYLVESLGFDAANVMLLQDERATKTDLEKHLGAWLKNRVDARSRVFVYYAGHGAPNPATGKGYLIPYEGDPNYTDETAYPIQSLHDTLAKLPAKEVTVVLDACFSGAGGRSLLAKGARPLVAQVAAKAAPNSSVITAASGAQISAAYPQGRHGLLTYFLLEGLHGAADADKNGVITTAELFSYARPAVEREARKQNLEQTPTMTGPGDTVWLER